MSFYLSSRKLDVRGGNLKIAVINEEDASSNGLSIGDKVSLDFAGSTKEIIVNIDTTDSLIQEGEIGFFEEFWEMNECRFGEMVKIDLVSQSEAVDNIRKKLLGGELTYDEIYSIIRDITNDRLDNVLTAYYVAAGYSPGFNEQEMFYMTKALAETGEILNFEGIVADKHSIGGVAGKGITPLVIPIVSTFKDIKLPNTSTRAVTSASATTDMLEVIMPMIFSKEKMEAMMLENNAVMVWGGGVDLAPADDKIIQIQKPLGIESIDKFVSSIVSKKIAQGVTHVIFDVPTGKGAKIDTEEDYKKVEKSFQKICKKFGIKVFVHRRKVTGIDGNAVGPALECREFLRIYERDRLRSLQLEEDALKMAGNLIELCGKADKGEGYKVAKDILESGKAFKCMKKIIEIQGGDPEITSRSLEIGGITWDFTSAKSGTIDLINNKKVFEVCKALGNSKIKEAGMYFYKKQGEKIEKGEKLATLYATSDSRMKLAKDVMNEVKVFEIV